MALQQPKWKGLPVVWRVPSTGLSSIDAAVEVVVVALARWRKTMHTTRARRVIPGSRSTNTVVEALVTRTY